jgi:internalin A
LAEIVLESLISKSLILNRQSFTDEVAANVPWDRLISVTNIDLRNCGLTSIPIGIAKLDSKVLTSLRLEGNNFFGFHRSLVESRASAMEIIITLRESLKGGMVVFNEMKVMVVGEPAVGKTTMLRILYGQKAQELAAVPCVATDGIDLGEITLEGYRLMFWDFAGQEVYRYTHQLFLSDNSVCLVMFRLTTEDETARKQQTYWMDSVLQRAPSAACLLVGTCASNFPEAVADSRLQSHLSFLRERYGDRICGAVAIDSLHDFGYKMLKKALVKVTKQKVSFWNALFATLN